MLTPAEVGVHRRIIFKNQYYFLAQNMFKPIFPKKKEGRNRFGARAHNIQRRRTHFSFSHQYVLMLIFIKVAPSEFLLKSVAEELRHLRCKEKRQAIYGEIFS